MDRRGRAGRRAGGRGPGCPWSSFAAGPGTGGAASGDPAEPAERVVAVAPLTAAAATLAGLLVLAGGDPRAPVFAGEPSPLPGAPAGAVALEQHLGVGLQPSDYGQTVVLAEGLGLEPGKRYEVVLRASPRGHRAGEVITDDNMVVVPAYAVAADVDTVILRDRDPTRAGNPGFDVHVACTREHVTTRVGEFYKLRPRDPNINLFQLMRARGLDGPYVPLHDYHFKASVRAAVTLGSNQTRHLLYEEPRPDDAPSDPSLRELITLGYAGPYLDPGGATEAPPLAFAGAPGPRWRSTSASTSASTRPPAVWKSGSSIASASSRSPRGICSPAPRSPCCLTATIRSSTCACRCRAASRSAACASPAPTPRSRSASWPRAIPIMGSRAWCRRATASPPRSGRPLACRRRAPRARC
ncbi:hypothetical protein [Nannocystis pusilla]|uniref:hypothetical protein n=1 Tax=Nannocystis pusilla TaxID=889268 RepID=UPI003B798075